MRPDTCIHFNGILKECCEQGVNYEQIAGGNRSGMWLRVPCLGLLKRTVPAGAECDKRQLPTPEQIAEDKARQAESVRKHLLAMPTVNVWRQKPPKGKYEIIECPVCKGNLHLHQSVRNGHVHGKCDSVGCVNWIE